MAARLVFGRMWFKNFGAFLGTHEFNWDRGGTTWFIAGDNKRVAAFGSNGAGKTTLVTALYWCLTGRTLRNNRPGDRIECRFGSGTTSVLVEVTIGDTTHEIERTRKPNSLTLDGNPAKEEDIIKLLGISPEAMLYTFIFGQAPKDGYFLDLTPEPQSKLLTDLLGADLWLAAAKNAGTGAIWAEKEAAALTTKIARLDGLLDELEDREEELRTQILEYDRKSAEVLVEIDERIADADAESTKWRQKEMALKRPADLPKEFTDAVKVARDNEAAWRQKASDAASDLRTTNLSITRLQRDQSGASEKGVCPTCGQRLDKANAAQAAKHFEAELKKLRKHKKDHEDAEAEANAETASWTELIAEYAGRLEAHQAKVSAYQTTKAEVERGSTTLSIRISELHAERDRAAGDNPYRAQLADTVKRIETTLADRKSVAGASKVHLKDADEARLWQDHYRTIRMNIIEDILGEISEAANRVAEDLGMLDYQIELSTEKEKKGGDISVGFNIMLYPAGEDEPVPFDTYCGGETTRWHWAVNFGLGEILLDAAGVSTNIMILDEPTKGLSAQGIDDLLACLSEWSQSMGKTIYLIDHHVLDRGAFDGVVNIERTASGSKILE